MSVEHTYICRSRTLTLLLNLTLLHIVQFEALRPFLVLVLEVEAFQEPTHISVSCRAYNDIVARDEEKVERQAMDCCMRVCVGLAQLNWLEKTLWR